MFQVSCPIKSQEKKSKSLGQRLGGIHLQVNTQPNFSKLLAMKKNSQNPCKVSN